MFKSTGIPPRMTNTKPIEGGNRDPAIATLLSPCLLTYASVIFVADQKLESIVLTTLNSQLPRSKCVRAPSH